MIFIEMSRVQWDALMPVRTVFTSGTNSGEMGQDLTQGSGESSQRDTSGVHVAPKRFLSQHSATTTAGPTGSRPTAFLAITRLPCEIALRSTAARATTI